MCGEAACSNFAKNTKTTRFEGLEEWKKTVFKFECEICAGERKRRHRVLPMLREKTDAHRSDDQSCVLESATTIPEHLQKSLRSSRFADCLFITRCNEPVGAYALQRARFLL